MTEEVILLPNLAGNLILGAKKLRSHSFKNGLTGSTIQLTFKIKYRYCTGGLIVKDLLLDNS